MTILHFSVGPVQGFIGEARRTRDLWGGSFLLSWLSAQAMLSVETAMAAAGGDPLQSIVFPEVAGDDLMEAVRRHKGVAWAGKARVATEAPHIGSVPNRFKAELPSADAAKAAASAATEALRDRWKALADGVWEAFVKEAVKDGNGTREIWERQIGSFWDIAWVAGPKPSDGSDGAWLDRRKNWRSHYPDGAEGGDHCQLMGLYQELSGFTRATTPGDREHQARFWLAMQAAGDPKSGKASQRVGTLNLRDRERLCAIALVKRLFPILSNSELERIIGWVPGRSGSDESSVNIRNWPSVAYVAAVPWLKEAWRLAGKEAGRNPCEVYQASIDDVVDRPPRTDQGPYGETETRLLGLGNQLSHPFFKLDGTFFHRDAVSEIPLERLKGSDDAARRANRETAFKAIELLLAGIYDGLSRSLPVEEGETSRRAFKSHPSEFYAVLIGDGDNIGRNLQTEEGARDAKAGLAKFTREAPDIVRNYNGATIYAGGDDVLAVLPLDEAIPAARDLRAAYASAFRTAASPQSWTFSAAIVFAQYKMPLRFVLAEAHRQLDDVAKEKNGRDSLALAVLKPGGLAFGWASAWEGVAEGETRSPPRIMQTLAQELQAKREYTTGFLYNIRERYEPLFDDSGAIDVAPEQMRKFLLAEHKRSGGTKDAVWAVGELVKIGYPLERKSGTPQPARCFSFDAGPLMRFLAVEGRWFMKDAGRQGGHKS
jgi:CRISPR-associated protein Cmr2